MGGAAEDRSYDEEGADRRLESVMLALRTDRGMPLEWITSSSPIVTELVERSLASVSGGRLILSDKGFLLLDEIVLRICAERAAADTPMRRLETREGP
jgi:hypothetical protein